MLRTKMLLSTALRAVNAILVLAVKSIRYQYRYKQAQHALSMIPESVLGDFGVRPMQLRAIAEYTAAAGVEIAAAIERFAHLPPAPPPDSLATPGNLDHYNAGSNDWANSGKRIDVGETLRRPMSAVGTKQTSRGYSEQRT